MSRLERALTAVGALVLIEFVAFLTVRSGALIWREWHSTAGLRWLATLGFTSAVATVGVVVWLIIVMVRP